jgi:hypothetical protein
MLAMVRGLVSVFVQVTVEEYSVVFVLGVGWQSGIECVREFEYS